MFLAYMSAACSIAAWLWRWARKPFKQIKDTQADVQRIRRDVLRIAIKLGITDLDVQLLDPK